MQSRSQILSTLLVIASLFGASQQQTSTASLLPLGFGGDNLTAEVAGTGPDGTTYIIAGLTDDLPFTMTLVQGATALTETAAIPALEITANAECTLSGDVGACELVVAGGTLTTITTSLSGTINLTPVPIVASLTSNSQVTVQPSSTMGSIPSLLPPVLSNTAPSSSPPAPTPSPTTTANSASFNTVPAILSVVIPALAVLTLF